MAPVDVAGELLCCMAAFQVSQEPTAAFQHLIPAPGSHIPEHTGDPHIGQILHFFFDDLKSSFNVSCFGVSLFAPHSS